ncbi:unnamed protein product [Cylicocyclus nassatus]|uniref:Uncharacterized protein n=1 Tax=Cylicocyclus nassatus TaxID=53992 RepID=A0AA36HDV8_CYLNA|nr:unnamed protein product [Cylicocyclus nassatus]
MLAMAQSYNFETGDRKQAGFRIRDSHITSTQPRQTNRHELPLASAPLPSTDCKNSTFSLIFARASSIS